MSSVPSEILLDVLQPLNRWTLDGVQFTNRRFHQLIMERTSDVCLREIEKADFIALEAESIGSSLYTILIGGRSERKLSKADKDTASLFSEFVQALRSSRVAFLALNGLVFTPELAALVLETPIIVRELSFVAARCAELTPAQLRQVLLHFSPTFLWPLTGHFRACQISDELVRALFKNRMEGASIPSVVPVDGGSFAVTDDVVVELCMQPDVQAVEEGDEPSADLVLHNGNFTKDLFKRLVEASSTSTRTQPLRIEVSPVPVANEDLREFAQHLSQRNRGQRIQMRIYDFPGEQHGAAAGIHLQIVLYPDKRLEMMRARRPNPLFYESD